MSNDISYVVKVVDDFSANLKKFQNEMGSAGQQALKYSQNVNQAQKSTKFFTQNLKDLGKAAGLYVGLQQIKQFGVDIFNTRIEMDSMASSLSAILPRFDKTKSGTQLAAEEMEYLRGVTNKLGVSFETALPSYMQFLAGSKSDLATTRKTFEAFAGLSRMYGLNTQRFGLVINALSQMQSKGVVSMEELRQQLGDSLPGALQLFADAAGMSTAKFTKLVSEGKIGAGIIKIVGENITRIYGQDIANASKTLGAETARLSNEWLQFKNILGEELAPTLTATITGLADGIRTINNFVNAFNGKSKISEMSEELQSLINTVESLKAAWNWLYDKDKASHALDKFEENKKNQKYGNFGPVDLGNYIGRKAFEMAPETLETLPGLQKSVNENLMGYANGSMAPKLPAQEITVRFANAPPGTTVEVKKSPTTNLNVGNTVSNGMGGAGEL